MSGCRGKMPKPSKQLLAYLNCGTIPDPAVASWARLFIYRRACAVLAAGDLHARREALQDVPEHVRADVEAEARRIFLYRKAK